MRLPVQPLAQLCMHYRPYSDVISLFPLFMPVSWAFSLADFVNYGSKVLPLSSRGNTRNISAHVFLALACGTYGLRTIRCSLAWHFSASHHLVHRFPPTGACARARFPHTSATSYVCRPSWGREPPWTLAYYTTSTRTSATPFWED